MSVEPIHGAVLESERKQQFLDSVAATFDRFVAEHGEEPDGIVYVFAGVRQEPRVGWHVTAESQGAAPAIKALALTAVVRDFLRWHP